MMKNESGSMYERNVYRDRVSSFETIFNTPSKILHRESTIADAVTSPISVGSQEIILRKAQTAYYTLYRKAKIRIT